jgi:hypothetical protein
MKKYFAILVFVICLIAASDSNAQSVTITEYFFGAQAWGCCDICGTDYMCISDVACGCCSTPQQEKKLFLDPVPTGNMVTGITIKYFVAPCTSPGIPSYINGLFVCSASDPGNDTCACISCFEVPCSNSYPGGMPGYVYGGMDTLITAPLTGTMFCVQRAEITLTYTVGIEEYSNNSITSFMPNPLITSAVMKLTKPAQSATLIIYNVLGKEIKRMTDLSGKEIIIQKDAMKTGIYFYSLSDKDGLVGKGKLEVE